MRVISARLSLAALLLPTLALGGCDVPKRPVVEGNINGSFFDSLFGRRCTLEITFGSYAMGIDSSVHASIKALVKQEDAIIGTSEKPWGKEGELAICVDMEDQAAADALQTKMNEVIAAAEPTKGPVTVTNGPLATD